MSNLYSVRQALITVGARPKIVESPEQLRESQAIVLPGVGSFAEGMARLAESGWVEAVRERVAAGIPMLGICLGMQLLATNGTEGGDVAGLDLIPGDVVHLASIGCSLRVPHVGWNGITSASGSRLLEGIEDDTDFYFVHSFAFRPARPESVLASTEYGIPIPAAVSHGRVFGTQFHPEKSSRAGLRLLKNFLTISAC
jgi:glutamine amidotransferase